MCFVKVVNDRLFVLHRRQASPQEARSTREAWQEFVKDINRDANPSIGPALLVHSAYQSQKYVLRIPPQRNICRCRMVARHLAH